MVNQILETITKDLENRPDNTPWSTAAGIARRLKKTLPKLTEGQVEQILLDYIKGDNLDQPLIRQSNLPSKYSLNILWGAIEKVGEKSKLNAPEKQGDVDPAFLPLDEQAESIFISHSHRDVDSMQILRNAFKLSDLSPWFAEGTIQDGEVIAHEILEALRSCKGFMVYLSKNALDSSWTRKEFEIGRHMTQFPTMILIDGAFSDLIEVLDLLINQKNIRATDYYKNISTSYRATSFIDTLEEAIKNKRDLKFFILGDKPSWQLRSKSLANPDRFILFTSKVLSEYFADPSK